MWKTHFKVFIYVNSCNLYNSLTRGVLLLSSITETDRGYPMSHSQYVGDKRGGIQTQADNRVISGKCICPRVKGEGMGISY